MSRLIVKNLPKTITEDVLRNLFGQKGIITDIQLKYTKDGVFRRFAFIGYKTEEQTELALKYFDNSCIQTNRIKVELCAPLGAEDKPKAWSKYSKESTAYKKIHGLDEIERAEKEKQNEGKLKKKTKDFVDEIIGEHKNDPEFIEFMQVHNKNRTLWDNDAEMVNDGVKANEDDEKGNKTGSKKKESKEQKESSNYHDELPLKSGINKKNSAKTTAEDSSNEDSGHKSEEIENEEVADTEESSTKLAEKEISDLEYMKMLMTKKQNGESKSKDSKKSIDLFTIKIHNLPYEVKRSDILKFFKPVKPYSVRLPTKVHGFCYVGFNTEKEFKKAMLKDKSFLKKKQVFFSDFTERNKITKAKKVSGNPLQYQEVEKKNSKWTKQEEAVQNEENISESGKIFFRNLAYTTSEDDLQKIFEKYGPIADINLPIDPITRKIKGFGTVTFVMPEHAVLAFSELDGTTFQGRLLHLIPGKADDKKENQEADENGLSFKARKALNLKKSANQSHNWNTLFLGANAIADIMSKRLGTTKEGLYDSQTGGFSAAVRLALGETELVLEMKKFLEENDVQLDVFDSVPKKRSKTVILVKNLPAETTATELRPLFSNFGLIGRFILPPSGITALVEFLDSSEAKKAFRKLAYSKFKNLPLYLEWAPENTFKTKVDSEMAKQNEGEEKHTKEEKSKNLKNKKSKNIEPNETSVRTENSNEMQEKKEKTEGNEKVEADNENDEEPEPDTTIFLRNLNFKTREGAIREHFKHLGQIHIVQVATKKDPEDPKKKTSLGYGFIQFKKKAIAQKALKEMQFTHIEGNQVELKRSDRILRSQAKPMFKKLSLTKQTGTKILVKNIPFQAKSKEVEDIFKTFGELRSVRLPRKMTPGENMHRGFGFVDFLTKSDAKKAFEALCQSTHLYGRRLILEWADMTDDDKVDELRKRTAEHFTGSKSNAKRSRKAVFDSSKIGDVGDQEDMGE